MSKYANVRLLSSAIAVTISAKIRTCPAVDLGDNQIKIFYVK